MGLCDFPAHTVIPCPTKQNSALVLLWGSEAAMQRGSEAAVHRGSEAVCHRAAMQQGVGQ